MVQRRRHAGFLLRSVPVLSKFGVCSDLTVQTKLFSQVYKTYNKACLTCRWALLAHLGEFHLRAL